jgi:hypothetical protein
VLVAVLGIAAIAIAWTVIPWPGDSSDLESLSPAVDPTDDDKVAMAADDDRAAHEPAQSPVQDAARTAPPPAAAVDSGPAAPAVVMGDGEPAGRAKGVDADAPAGADDDSAKAVPPTILPSITPSRAPNPAPSRDGQTASTRIQQQLQNGWNQLAANRLVEARRMLSQVLASGGLSLAEADHVRQSLSDISDRLVFSPLIQEGDPFVLSYTIQGGDALSGVASRLSLQADWRFIQRINNISQPSRIRAGQRIKLVTGPFHVVVHKGDYRLDLYMGDGDDRVFVRSFPVGLGEFNSTPVGLFRIRPDSKLVDPVWIDPRTNRKYAHDDPANPIGERWLGLEGVDERTRELAGYGIHGTIEPDSIGRQASMGCIRMHSEDVEIIYEVLMEGVSTVEIRAE